VILALLVFAVEVWEAVRLNSLSMFPVNVGFHFPKQLLRNQPA
jgi:hypothetical protein